MQDFLFFHGGPGLNSAPEAKLIGPKLQGSCSVRIHFWNEPSALRPGSHAFRSEDAFRNLLDSAQARLVDLHQCLGKQVFLVGHSFGATTITELARRHADKIAGLVYLAPTLNPPQTDRNIFSLARMDFRERQDHRADLMNEILAGALEEFDDLAAKGYALALEDENLLSHYFGDLTVLASYLGFLEGEYAIDGESLFSVRRSAWPLVPGERTGLPSLFIFGADDPVTPLEQVRDLIVQSFPNVVEVLRYPKAKHFPHLENPDAFLKDLETFGSRVAPIVDGR